jgi:hypothetical protein
MMSPEEAKDWWFGPRPYCRCGGKVYRSVSFSFPSTYRIACPECSKYFDSGDLATCIDDFLRWKAKQ